MNSLKQKSVRVRRKRMAALAALPVGIAATAIAVTAVLGATPPPQDLARADASNQADTSHRTVEPTLRVVGAYFTVQRSGDGLVQLRITDQAGKADLARLQKELNKAGVPSRVLAGDPARRPRATGEKPGSRQVFWISMDGGTPVLAVQPAEIPADQEMVVGFPHAATDRADALGVIMGALIDHKSSYCVPAPPR